MIQIRRSDERGHAEHGWLDSYHTFSFAGYYDPQHMGYRSLRVINEDIVDPGTGFDMHPHADMEIITYVIDGQLEHKDSMGNGEVIHAGEVQVMSAGTGIQHSEFNPSATQPVHLMQIWIKPEKRGITPAYAQRLFPAGEKENRLRLIAAKNARDGALHINQDAELYAAAIKAGKSLQQVLKPSRHAWVQVLSGEVEVNGATLRAGDAAAIKDEKQVDLLASKDSEILFFDLA